MKGGVVTKMKDISLDEILGNSERTPLSNGAYGYTMSVKAPEGFDTGFINYETGEIVRHFILKIVPIDVNMAYKEEALPIVKENYSKLSSRKEFEFEAKMLQHCYTESLTRHHVAICPAMLHSFICTVSHLEKIIPSTYAYAYVDIPRLLDESEYAKSHVGILFMECAPGETLYEYLMRHPHKKNEIKRKSLGLYCTALDCGINHNDPNKGNIMIDSTGNLLLIDFGLAYPIRNRDLYTELIKKSVKSNQYSILKELLSHDLYKKGKLFHSYEWFFDEPFQCKFPTKRLPEKIVRDCLTGLCKVGEEHALPIVTWGEPATLTHEEKKKLVDEMTDIYFEITHEHIGEFYAKQAIEKDEEARLKERLAEREALYRAQLAAALEEEKRAAEKRAVEKRAADLKAERAARKRATQERAEAIRTKRRTERDLFGKLTEKNRSLIRHFATPSSNPLKNATAELEEEIIKLIGHLPSLEEIEADLNTNLPTQRLIQSIKEKTPNDKINEIYRIFIRKHKPRGGTRKHKKH